MPDSIQLGEVPDRPFTSWLERALMLGVIVLGLLSLLLFRNQQEIRQAQRAGETRGYVNRAVACRVLVALGLEIPRGDDCRDPKVTEFYNPDLDPVAGSNSIGQRYNRDLICAVLEAVGAPRTNCTVLPGSG